MDRPSETGIGSQQTPGSPATEGAAAAVACEEPEPLTVGYVSESYGYLPLYLALDEGYFDERDVVVEPLSLPSSSRTTAALLGGSVDIALSSPAQTILAQTGGEDVQMVGGLVNAAMYTLVGQPEVQTMADLTGERVGVAGSATGDVLMLQDMLAAEGIDPQDQNIAFVQVGGTPDRLAALQSNSIAAGMLLSPHNYSAVNEGLSPVANAYDYVEDFQFTAINTYGDRTACKDEAIVRMIAGLSDAVRAIHEDPEVAHGVAMERLEVSRELAEAAYDDYIGAEAFPEDLSYNEAGIQVVVDQLVGAGTLTEADVPDMSQYTTDELYLEAAQRSTQAS